MNDSFVSPLLCPGDSLPFEVLRGGGKSPVLIVCDHAGRRIPTVCGSLGLREEDLSGHIAWDIGARDIAIRMAERLDATLVCGVYSRLVIDLNRYPWDPAAVPEISDTILVPYNRSVSNPERQRRIDELHRPYHAAISGQLDRIAASGVQPILLSVHTMTDKLSSGRSRDEHYAVLWSERDPELSQQMLAWLIRNAEGLTGDNTPYSLDIGIDFTVPEHGFRRQIPTFMFEVRQDLVSTAADASQRADLLSDGLVAVLGDRLNQIPF